MFNKNKIRWWLTVNQSKIVWFIIGWLTTSGITLSIILIFSGASAIADGIITLGDYRRKLKDQPRDPNKPDNFVEHAYNGWKNKFCVKINFIDKGEKHDDNISAI